MSTWFITGSSRGIGLEFCKVLLAKGHTVYGACRNPEGCRDHWELKADFKNQFHSIKLDVMNQADIEKLSKDFASTEIDVLVNNAGVLLGGSDSFENLKFEEIEKSFQVNTIAPMKVTKALMASLLRAKNPKVVHISSKMGSQSDNTSGGHYGYRMSKAALNMYCRSFTADYPKVCSIVMHPGWVQTEMGGSQAPVSVHDSATGLVKVIEGVSLKDSGSFLDFKGEKVPW